MSISAAFESFASSSRCSGGTRTGGLLRGTSCPTLQAARRHQAPHSPAAPPYPAPEGAIELGLVGLGSAQCLSKLLVTVTEDAGEGAHCSGSGQALGRINVGLP